MVAHSPALLRHWPAFTTQANFSGWTLTGVRHALTSGVRGTVREANLGIALDDPQGGHMEGLAPLGLSLPLCEIGSLPLPF